MSAKLNKLQYKLDETYAVASLNKDRLDLMHNRFCHEICRTEQNIIKTIKEQVQPPVANGTKEDASSKTPQKSETMSDGIKNDFKDGKLRWDLLPLEDLEEVVQLYTFGVQKYGVEHGWKELENGEDRYRGAMLRHLLQHLKGEEFDQESKVRHLSAVIWNAIAMYHCFVNKKKNDNQEGKEQ